MGPPSPTGKRPPRRQGSDDPIVPETGRFGVCPCRDRAGEASGKHRCSDHGPPWGFEERRVGGRTGVLELKRLGALALLPRETIHRTPVSAEPPEGGCSQEVALSVARGF